MPSTDRHTLVQTVRRRAARWRKVGARMAGPVCAAALAPAAVSAEDARWTYTGANGPAHWGALDAEALTCAVGEQQSPIDLSAAVPALVTPPRRDWTAAPDASIVNNGHTLQVSLDGAGAITHGPRTYALKQIHFHHPSEHTVDGRAFPLEAHFVHAAPDGALAVVGVLFEEGDAHPVINDLWDMASPTPAPATPLGAFDPRPLAPRSDAAFHYAGSLTTPPCSEIVTWTVLTTPLTVSAEQIAAFKAVFDLNARPVQPRNRRFVLATQ